jgi:hypothetical protein
MTSFVRFIFAILVAGMVVNLLIVLLANVQSQRIQTLQYRQDAAAFKAKVSEIEGHVRRADIIVESQQMDGHDKALESRLLIRQYASTGSSQEDPLPVMSLVIVGDQLQAGAVMLEFDHMFAPENEDYAPLRNRQILFFDRFRGVGDERAMGEAAGVPFTFFPRNEVPALIRIHPLAAQPSLFETQLWQYLWTSLPDPPRDAKHPWNWGKGGSGLKATWLKPATITVRRRHTYTAYVSADGAVSLDEDQPGISGLFAAMWAEGEKLRAAASKPGILP